MSEVPLYAEPLTRGGLLALSRLIWTRWSTCNRVQSFRTQCLSSVAVNLGASLHGREYTWMNTLVTGSRRSLSRKLSDTRVYEPYIH